jgi:hypothetical protein
MAEHSITQSDSPIQEDQRVNHLGPVYLILIAVVLGIVMTAGPSTPFDPFHEWWAERGVVGWVLGLVVGIGWVFVRGWRRVTG